MAVKYRMKASTHLVITSKYLKRLRWIMVHSKSNIENTEISKYYTKMTNSSLLSVQIVNIKNYSFRYLFLSCFSVFHHHAFRSHLYRCSHHSEHLCEHSQCSYFYGTKSFLFVCCFVKSRNLNYKHSSDKLKSA